MISPDENSLPPENSKQRSDYTGNFIEDIDNSAELEAIAKDPTIFPNSTRIYVEGKIHENIRVPMREIRLSDTEHQNGVIENAPIRVYDCSGPWGDPEFDGDVATASSSSARLDSKPSGCRGIRRSRGQSNGQWLPVRSSCRKIQRKQISQKQAKEYPHSKRKPLRSTGKPVTQSVTLIKVLSHRNIHRHSRKHGAPRGIQNDS